MATIGTAVTLMDIARRLDANDKIQRVVELLAQRLEVLDDIPWMEGNLFTGHKTTIRTGLPSVVFRQFNQGLQPAKSTTAQIVDACAMMEARSSIDKALADLNGNTAEFRLSEDMAFIEALDQKFSTTLFYGDTRTNPDQFFGFAPRFSTLSTNNTKSGYNIIDAGGVGATNTSIWCVGWGDNTAFGIYPKGTKAGIEHEDLGEQVLLDTQSPPGRYQGYESLFKWNCGLCVRDWRYVTRIANIDVPSLLANAGAQADLIANLIKATNKIWDLKTCTPAIYMTRDVRTFFEIQAEQKTNSRLTWEEGKDGGQKILSFRGIPIRRVDSLLTTEARVTASTT